jgi:nucleotide-binding universal stress UspA family protein
MDSFTRVLLPVDFSESSAGAVHCAHSLACHFGSELTLLHVLVPPQCEFGAADVAGSMLAELCRDRAAQATLELGGFMAAELNGLNVRRVVLEGDPSTTIVEYAHREQTRLIIMPTHGYGPFRRYILGSNTAKVLHDADCPVWTGTHLSETPVAVAAPFHHVMCAVDLGPQSAKTLAWAAHFAREFEARLTLFHVTACDPQLRSSAGDALNNLRNQVGATTAELDLESGEASRQICAAAKRQHADVLVIGRGSAAGVFGRLRTNAYAIIRESPCPVVSV